MPESLLEPKKNNHSSFSIQYFLEYGLYLFVFLLPWQTKLILRPGMLAGGDWEYGTISLYGTDILLIVLLILALILSRQGAPSRGNEETLEGAGNNHGDSGFKTGLLRCARNDKAVWIILSGLDLFVFLSIFFAPDTALALSRYALFLLGLGLFWLLVKTEYDKKKMAIAFFAALLIQAAIAIGQFLTQTIPACKWLGLAAHSAGNLGDSVVETIGAGGVPERWLRAYGSLDHPNILGGLLAIGLVIIIALIVNHQRVANKKTDYKFIIYHSSLVIIFVALVFTFSRSAMLALAVGIVIVLIGGLAGKDKSRLKKLGGIILLLAIVSSIIFINYGNLLLTRSSVDSRLEIKSISERQLYLNDSFNLLKKDWLFGAGIGNYTKALAVQEPQRAWYGLNPVHDVFLLIWSEVGIGGFLFFLALLIYLFIRSMHEKNILSLSILTILVIIMMLDHYLWSLHFGVLFFWLLLGFVYKSLLINKV
jgi:hypothetical protein